VTLVRADAALYCRPCVCAASSCRAVILDGEELAVVHLTSLG
jgi:hypothetical protein